MKGTPQEPQILLPMKHNPFAKEQKESIKKALSKTACPLKPKHARTIILGTHQEQSCTFFWDTITSIQLESHPIVTWKFCHLLHILIKDGHPSVVDESQRHIDKVAALGEYWTQIKDKGSKYSSINSLYCKVIAERLKFHVKFFYQIPGNLTLEWIRDGFTRNDSLHSTRSLASLTDERVRDMKRRFLAKPSLEWIELRKIQHKPNEAFAACMNVLNLMDSLLILQREVFKSLEVHEWSSHGPKGQMLLAPLFLVLKDISKLYNIALQYMFHLHTLYPYQNLEGHRTLFQVTFHETKTFYESVKKCEYFEQLATVSDLPEIPPNFIQSFDDCVLHSGCINTVGSKGGRSPSDGIDLLSTLQLHERSYRNESVDSQASTPPSAPLLYDFVGGSRDGTLKTMLNQHEHRSRIDQFDYNPFSQPTMQSRGVYENL